MQGLENILEEIEDLQDISGWDLQTVQGVLDTIRKHMNDDWIPVDDRLPEIRDYGSIKVWMTIAYPAGNATRQGFFENGRFINLNGSQIADKIIAWKPYQKPEPYQENRNS